jgi:hypothetical protein
MATSINKAKRLLQQLPDEQAILLRQLLANPCSEVWMQTRRVVLCNQPFLTLEMALKRVSEHSLDNEAPDPFLVHEALSYAWEKDQSHNKKAANFR